MEINFSKSKIFLYLCLSFVLGILVASFLKFPILALFSIVSISIIFISIFWREKKIAIAGFCLIFLVLGIYRFQSVSVGKNFITQYNDSKEKITLQGIVVEEPDVRIKDTQYVVKVQNSNKLGSSASKWKPSFQVMPKGSNMGKVLVTLPHYPVYQYGDLIELEGKLKSPAEFDSFSYKDYLAKDGIYSVMYSPAAKLISENNGNYLYTAIFKLKNKFKEKIKAVLPEPENSLLSGLLLGERSGLSQNLKDDFAITGTSHIIAVSGFNVTIIAVIILELALAFGFSRAQSFWISLAAIILFIIMVGAPSSAIRAGIMGGLALIATRTGRLNSAVNAIVFAATAMVAINPKILRFDAGFELSFLAVIGLVWLYPVLEKYFSTQGGSASGGQKTFIFKIKSMLLITISAQIMALPILLYDFNRLSLVAPLANILILPFVPLAMALGFLAGLSGFVWLGLAKVIGYFAWFVLAYQIRAIEFLASLTWSSVEIFNFDILFLVAYYLIIAVVLIKYNKKERLA